MSKEQMLSHLLEAIAILVVVSLLGGIYKRSILRRRDTTCAWVLRFH